MGVQGGLQEGGHLLLKDGLDMVDEGLLAGGKHHARMWRKGSSWILCTPGPTASLS